jgi:hypothetical protein
VVEGLQGKSKGAREKVEGGEEVTACHGSNERKRHITKEKDIYPVTGGEAEKDKSEVSMEQSKQQHQRDSSVVILTEQLVQDHRGLNGSRRVLFKKNVTSGIICLACAFNPQHQKEKSDVRNFSPFPRICTIQTGFKSRQNPV